MSIGQALSLLATCALALGGARAAAAPPDPGDDTAAWSLHGQMTQVTQWHGGFRAPYSGANSLYARSVSAETTDATLFIGRRLWRGAALYLNPELDQGYGLSNTLGVAGFPSAEAYKVGNYTPYLRLQRAYVQQRIDLGGERAEVGDDVNQLAGSRSADNLTITVGKFSVVDLFDANRYAHDPRGDFLNWSFVDTGAFDYAADAWGYTLGAAVEWSRGWWTLRAGLFDFSAEPNSERLDPHFHQYQWVGEFEVRHRFFGRPGTVRLLGFLGRARMGRYADAVALAQRTGTTPDTSLVRQRAQRGGAVLNLEQELGDDLGFFARAGANDGAYETFDFTDINRSLAAGLSLQGQRWGRPDDTVGAAFALNALSASARGYFAAGGMGVLIGDGRLAYGREQIAELYYRWQALAHLAITLDLQHVVHPAYNRDRGPVTLAGVRLHAQF